MAFGYRSPRHWVREMKQEETNGQPDPSPASERVTLNMALNYKKTFMVIGNRLVQEHGFDPAIEGMTYAQCDRSTTALRILTEFFNQHPEARQLLHELGGEWPMPDSTSEKPENEVRGIKDMTEQEFRERNDAPWET